MVHCIARSTKVISKIFICTYPLSISLHRMKLISKTETMMWILLAGAGVLMVAFFYNTCIKPLSYWKNLGVKQTKPWPLFGDSAKFTFRKFSFCEFVHWLYNLYPDTRYFGFYQFTKPTLLLRDPELIKQILVKDFDYFANRRSFVDPEADPLWGANLAVLTGQKWQEMRATLSGSFTGSKMKTIFSVMEEASQNFVQFFLGKDEDIIEIELRDTYTRYTNDVIATAAFGIKCDSLAQPNNEFFLMGTSAINLSGITLFLKFFGYLVMPKLFKMFKISFFDKEISNFFRRIINDTIKTREEEGIVRPDMINLLLEARKTNKGHEALQTGSAATVKDAADFGKFKKVKNFTNDDITAQALIFFLAGFDTISTALCFGSYELAINRDIQDKLREEIKETFQNGNGKLTYDTLLKMQYMDMVVSEILRKWPPGPGIDRVCTKPYTIKAITADENPVSLKVGDVIMIPIQGIHRDPANYPNPEKFNPERFSDENKDSIKQYTYLPFGSGPRNCIGSRFGLLEIKALLFHLLLNFEIVVTKKTPIPLLLDRTTWRNTAKGGFWLGFKRIKN